MFARLLIGVIRLYQRLISPMLGPALPLRAKLQPIFHRVGAEIRGRSRHIARPVAHPPLQSLAPRRLRPAVINTSPNRASFEVALFFYAYSSRKTRFSRKSVVTLRPPGVTKVPYFREIRRFWGPKYATSKSASEGPVARCPSLACQHYASASTGLKRMSSRSTLKVWNYFQGEDLWNANSGVYCTGWPSS